MLDGQDKDLSYGIDVKDSSIAAQDGHQIGIRIYEPATTTHEHLAIYFHGGGLKVGDLDSEDLDCRRICKEASIKVISVDYRLLPDVTPEIALQDAYNAFTDIVSEPITGRLILVGSSSGGQLAAQVSQRARAELGAQSPITGVLLRCPVTVDASHKGSRIPERFRNMHISYSESFSNCLIPLPSEESEERTSNMPLEANDFAGLPKTFLQLCSNDIFYSDGICYAEALKDAGVEVKTDVLIGWPHTFWLKAPTLDKALEAEKAMVEGVKWLLD